MSHGRLDAGLVLNSCNRNAAASLSLVSAGDSLARRTIRIDGAADVCVDSLMPGKLVRDERAVNTGPRVASQYLFELQSGFSI